MPTRLPADFNRRFPVKSTLGLCAALLGSVHGAQADTATVVSDANTLVTNASPVATTYSLATDKQWTNLPGGTRNGPTIGGGALATSTDISTTARTAALKLSTDALSTAGYNTMNEIRLADDVIRSSAAGSGQSWNYSNYHIATLGTPSTTTAWMLQISGHHLTYNITYNSAFVSATPVFLGTEPPDYYRLPSTNATYPNYAVVKGTISGAASYIITNPDKTANGSSSNVTTTTTDPGVSSGTKHAPLETQRSAVSALAISIQADTTLKTSAKLTGTFSDVVMGVTNNGDGNFPFIGTTPTYPTGTTGRGALYTSMSTAQKALVKTMIEAWVNTQASDISTSLLKDYESDAALATTYVGYQVGTGAADGGATRANFDTDINAEATPVNSQNSYIRVDGPRCWIEFVVQAAVAYQSQKFVHYHTLWRDKLADYGNEFGGFLNTTKAATTYTRPTITTQPANVSGSSATFTVAATANVAGSAVTPSYQWYNASGAISGATSTSYTTTTAGSYYVTASTAYGTTTSNTVTFTVSGTAPAVTSQPSGVNVILGNSASFTAAASGTATLSYQWYKGSVGSGTAIAGATSATYAIATTTTSSGGTYYCVVTNSFGSATTSGATLTVTEPLANFLSNYGLSSYTEDTDGDGITNLLEFVLGGNPTASGTSVLPTSTLTASNGTNYLVFSFYTPLNLGSVTTSVQYSTDLNTWTTAMNNTDGVTITTSAATPAQNYTTVTIPNSGGGQVFARLLATVPGTYAGTYSSVVSENASRTGGAVPKTKTIGSSK